MKPKHSPLLFLAAALAVVTSSLRAPAQDDTVTISGAEFQRMVYSAHLLTVLAEKPELDASVQVLLELHRRNPNAAPNLLAGVLQEATARYRTNAPSYIRTRGSRDEILAAYLDTLRQVSAPTNLIPANLQLLNGFMLGPDDYTNASAAELIHSGNQRLVATVDGPEERRRLLDASTRRAQGNAAFAEALDRFMEPEALVSVRDTAATIIENTNSALSGNLTMTTLLALSAGSGNGSLTVSSNQLMNLFTNETQTLWETVHTNLALRSEFNQRQPDLLNYLTNQAAQTAWVEHEATVRQGQARKIASSSAAIMVQSQLTQAPYSQIAPWGKWMGPVGDVIGGVVACAVTGNPGQLISGAFKIFGLFDTTESPEEAAVREIGNVKTLIGDLSQNMNYRFDRVDKSLTTIFGTLNDEFGKIEITLDAQGRQIAHLTDNVDDIRRSLVGVQTDLHRLERHLHEYVTELFKSIEEQKFNTYLGYEATYGIPMVPADYNEIEGDFFTHARNYSVGGLSSPYLDRVYTPSGLYAELTESGGGTSNRLDQNLCYIKKYLDDHLLAQPTGGTLGALANPRDWFVGAYAYAQLAVENPMYFRRVNPANRLDLIVDRGNALRIFLRSLTFDGTEINWPLFAVVQSHYVGRLNNFNAQVHSIEQQFASSHGFALDTWRQWSDAAPRLNTISTEVLVTSPLTLPPIPRDATDIAAGGYHSLALKRDGTVIAWGRNNEGQSTVPASTTNVAAIAAGAFHTLALKSNGVVVAWGSNSHSQTNTPADATNVSAVSAGQYHSLALRNDGAVVGWGAGSPGTSGSPHYGQATIPDAATNIAAIAAGGYHSLALRADGTLLFWGLNTNNQLDIPESATNVMAIAAGHGHCLVLKSNRTLVAWGNNLYGCTDVPLEATNIVAIAAAGWHNLAKRADGTVLSWGRSDNRQTIVPFGLSHVQKLAAGLLHSLALKEDGTVLSWGANHERQALVPPALSWQNALSANGEHFLALRHDGAVLDYLSPFQESDSGLYQHPWATNALAMAAGSGDDYAVYTLILHPNGQVVGWGSGWASGSDVPVSATNVVAIAAGWHGLALRSDGTVLGWGDNNYGQATGVPNTAFPSASTGIVQVAGQTLSNVVSIAAGLYHSLALQADGRVVGWGYNESGQATGVPTPDDPYFSAGVVTLGGETLTNVVALAGGSSHSLALRADGTVVAWGDNGLGQTNVPTSVTNVVAIAAGADHCLALRADGAIVGWGLNDSGQTDTPAVGTNVVAIAAGGTFSVALRSDGTVIGWGESFHSRLPIPSRETNVISVAAGGSHNLALRSDGTLLAWGLNDAGQLDIPASATNVQAIAAGFDHSLALKADGTVVGWGYNNYTQANGTLAGGNVVAIAAGYDHSLALKTDGTVFGWGANALSQATGVPYGAPGSVQFQGRTLTNVVAIAAGSAHSLALRADGTVVGWGNYQSGQISIPLGLNNVVAVAAGYHHSLALKSDGTVVGWGWSDYGLTNGALAGGNVVAIAAGYDHNLALKADGMVFAWGRTNEGQTTIPAGTANVIAIAAGNKQGLFVTATETGGFIGTGDPFVVRARIPDRVGKFLYGVNGLVLTNLDLDLHDAAIELSGTKALLQAVLELALPYTLERDDVFRGFLYGNEPLVDLESARLLLTDQQDRLGARPDARVQSPTGVAGLRFQRFSEQLTARLNDLAAAGEPELPRIVGHTLRLLNLLRDAWAPVPPPALEIGRASNNLGVLLYGEPYAHYTLQYRDSLSVPGWMTTTVTNLHNEEFVTLPVSGPHRFYRAMLPVP